MIVRVDEYRSPVGRLVVAVRDERLCALAFAGGWAHRRARLIETGARIENGRNAAAVDRLDEYFGGQLDALDALAVDPAGTAFQRAVWTALRAIPAGRTASYGDVARRIGAPAAVRAVGAANGANPIALVVPCHRVIGSDGSLTGYGGGLDRKRWLLAHEGALSGALSGPLAAEVATRG